MDLNNKIWKRFFIGDLTFKRLFRSLLIIYIFLMVYVYFVSDSMMFLPHPPFYKDGTSIIKLVTDDGKHISAKYLKHDDSAYTILYSHGNSEDIDDIQSILRDFYDRGFSIISYDYHGYGTSEGKPTELNTYRDIEATYSFLTDTIHVPSNRIIAVGFSLGNGPTTYLAAKNNLAGVVLQAPFVTAFRVVTHIPILPFDRFPNIKNIKSIQKPILIIHGTNDDTIPFWHGKKLFELANKPKYHLWVEGAGHFDITEKGGQKYWDAVDNFVQKL